MRDSREKGAGMRDQDPPPPLPDPDPRVTQSIDSMQLFSFRLAWSEFIFISNLLH